MVENSRYRLSLYLEVVVNGRGITDDSLEEGERGAATGSPIQISLGREDWIKGDGRPVSEWKGWCGSDLWMRGCKLSPHRLPQALRRLGRGPHVSMP
jgi:hypothetical protein